MAGVLRGECCAVLGDSYACSGSTDTIAGDHLWVALATQRHRMTAPSAGSSPEAVLGRMLSDLRALLLCMTGLDVLVLGVRVSVHEPAVGSSADFGCMTSRINGKNPKLVSSRLA